MTDFIVRGVPDSIANDGWWLASETPEGSESEPKKENHDANTIRFSPTVAALLIAVVILADLLFWEHPVGLSLVVYSAALCGVAIFSLDPRFSARKWQVFGGVWIACALPVVEFVQTASVLILVLGHLGLLIWCAVKSASLQPMLRYLVQLPYLMPRFSYLSTRAAFLRASVPDNLKIRQDSLLVWLLPLIIGSAFFLLFVGANPVFEQWADRATRIDFSAFAPGRAVFWVLVGFAALPFVAFAKLAKGFKADPSCSVGMPKQAEAFVNTRSITISLILFNGMFFAQNITDLAFLWGGAALPDGLTYAEYAQQGAYPLMTTSILAGLFVLLSRRFISTAPLLKLLLLIWISQNIFLVFSALARLDLYVDVYGFTYLRIRAGIGMGLVMAGMALLGWQLYRKKSNTWVTTAFVGLCAATLYTGCFVNFGHLIARENLARGDSRVDIGYICMITPLNYSALLQQAQSDGHIRCEYQSRTGAIAPEGWRDWSFRKGRLAAARRDYLVFIDEADVTSLQTDSTNATEESTR